MGGDKCPSRPHSEGEKIKYKQKGINKMVFQITTEITPKVWRLEEKELALNFLNTVFWSLRLEVNKQTNKTL